MLHDEKWLVFRSFPPVVADLPLSVRSVGHYTLTPDWKESPWQKWFLQLFWGISGKGKFLVGDEWITLPPNHIFIYYPGDTHDVRAITDVWSYNWITFDHKDITHWFNGFGITERIFQASQCPQSLFIKIRNAVTMGTAEGERTAASLAHNLLVKASSRHGITTPSSNSIRTKALLEHNFMRVDIGIKEVAEELKVHRSTLFRQFTTAYGLTPSAYLRNLRIQHGLFLLRQGNTSIQDIAWQSGFTDANYFARAVRASTGLSPLEFRKSYPSPKARPSPKLPASH